MKWYNIIGHIKLFINRLIAKEVKRELAVIFRTYGEVNIDHHIKEDSWAVIKLDTGPKTCYLKFINLDRQDLRDIYEFLSRYDRSKIDTTPIVGNQINRLYCSFNF
jgi:G3E family GTPase